MTAQDLKNSILQRAMQGKLVEQRDDEGTAAELLIKIKAEKDRLIKDGKMKKEKPLPEISEDEIPFDIPDSWEWVRLGDVYDIIMGQSPDGNSVSDGADGMEFHQGKIFFGETYIQKSNQVTNKPSKIAQPNSVLLCVRAPVGIVNITDRELCIGRGLCDIIPLVGMSEKFVLYSVRCLKDTFIKKATGTTFVAITGEVVKNQIFPLPPLAEQKRIVAKIEELMSLVEQYGKAYDKLTQLNNKFPEDMRKSILQYAMQGKLVEQRAEEGTAEELLKQIRAEKDRLIKEGKIKKEKPLPEITDEEKPFDIPDSWEWVRLGHIGVLTRGSGIKRTDTVENGLPCIRYGELYTTYKTKFAETKSFTTEDVYNKSLKINNGDVLMTLTGENKTDISMALTYEGCTPVAMGGDMTCWSNHLCNPLFLTYLINSPYAISCKRRLATGDIIVHMSNDKLANIPLPLPPLAEQHRIVEAIENLMPYCRQLSK